MHLVLDRGMLASYLHSLNTSRFVRDIRPIEEVLSTIGLQEVVLDFSDSPSLHDLPRQIIIHEKSVEDFFGWASTFSEFLKPLTAFIEINTREDILSGDDRLIYSGQQLRGMLAVTVMDGIAQNSARAKVSQTIISDVSQSLSAVYFQAASRNANPSQLLASVSSWTHVRASLDVSETQTSMLLMQIWSILLRANSVSRSVDVEPLVQTIAEASKPTSNELIWQGPDYGALPENFEAFLRLSREDRFRYATEAVRLLRSRFDPMDMRAAALAGYLLSLVSDGDFNLWSSTTGPDFFPGTPYWFAFFNGASIRTNLLQFNFGIARRILTKFLSKQSSDIDAHEFLALRKSSQMKAIGFPLLSPDVLQVRLGRDIFGSFSLRKNNSFVISEPQINRSGEEKRQLQIALQKLTEVQREIVSVLNQNSQRSAPRFQANVPKSKETLSYSSNIVESPLFANKPDEGKKRIVKKQSRRPKS